ncbi:MAG: hypothetical protein ABJO67_09670 [Pseudoruegeria sp.]
MITSNIKKRIIGKWRPVSYWIVAEEMRTIKKKMKQEKASY